MNEYERVAIEIPDEFINEYKKDKFDESLARIITDIDIDFSAIDKFTLTGRYELEILKILFHMMHTHIVYQ